MNTGFVNVGTGLFGRECQVEQQATSTVSTTPSTTPSAGTRLCVGGLFFDTFGSCSCGSIENCFSCNVDSRTLMPVSCAACANSNYLFSGLCFADCSGNAGATREVGTGDVGRICAPETTSPTTSMSTTQLPTCTGRTSTDGSFCSCASIQSCAQCLLDQSGDPTDCLICGNSQFLSNGACHNSCDAFPGTTPTGEGTVGRECV